LSLAQKIRHWQMVVPLKSIIAICGTTGVGKSKLAIDLALHINRASHISGWRRAKIINADSMQVYKGLDVITNKVSESEMQGVEHLLMDFKQPGQQYIVGEWIQDTLKLVRQRFYVFPDYEDYFLIGIFYR
jgi:tRNA dimethylallyltransferase